MQQAKWSLGCQARPWLQTLGREAFAQQLPDVMRQIGEIGFDGFETALDCLPLEDPDGFKAAQAAADGLRLSAAHTGGRWWDPEMAGQMAEISKRIAKLPALGCNRLLVSIGGESTDLDDNGIAVLAGNLDTLGMDARRAGVHVALHNHAHELHKDARVLRAILDRTESNHLSLGADLGWVAFAGWDIGRFISEFGGRIEYLHLRDITQRDGKTGFTETGQGTLDWPAITTSLNAHGYRGWLVAESEFTAEWLGSTDPVASATAQLAGLRKIVAT